VLLFVNGENELACGAFIEAQAHVASHEVFVEVGHEGGAIVKIAAAAAYFPNCDLETIC